MDGAERFALVSNTDSYWSWLAALRELTEIVGVAMIFFIGSKSRDELPAMFLQEEVMTRIGVSNYVEFYNQGREDLRDFLNEMFQTMIRKGPVPEALQPVLAATLGSQLDDSIPETLQAVVDNQGESLETYPFTSEALEQLIEDCATSDLSNKPREVLIRVQKAASRAVRKGSRLIDSAILEEISK